MTDYPPATWPFRRADRIVVVRGTVCVAEKKGERFSFRAPAARLVELATRLVEGRHLILDS